jgi:hypothetical protein
MANMDCSVELSFHAIEWSHYKLYFRLSIGANVCLDRAPLTIAKRLSGRLLC